MKPLAITLGDPAGIGPEVAAKTLATTRPALPWLLVGSRWALQRGAQVAGVELPEIVSVETPAELEQGIGLIDINVDEPDDFVFGEIQAGCGRAAVLAVAGDIPEVRAVVTVGAPADTAEPSASWSCQAGLSLGKHTPKRFV